jgi:hypothetical protein
MSDDCLPQNARHSLWSASKCQPDLEGAPRLKTVTDLPFRQHMVSVGSIVASGLAGIASGAGSAAGAARDLAEGTAPDVASDFVTLSQGSLGVAVGAKLVETAEQVDATLLDIIA